MSNTKKKRIRVSLAALRSADASVVARGQAVVEGLTGNPRYPNPPIDPVVLKAALEVFSIAIVNALDRGRKAIIARKDAREAVIRMLRALAHYVESACNDDMKTFLSSGFEPLIIMKSAPQPLSGASIRRIAYGLTGQLLVRVNSVPQAWSYELRYAPCGPGGPIGTWTVQAITAVRHLVPCNGLTAGTTYTFQVRALGRLGYSDWSDSIVKMCT